ncbi:hypothetical protein IU487_32950 [Nocardia puris]|uniref:DUF6088 family protein n=1 Tax=Nocardia puris TaxID=208602 RepID=UPI0018957508|nr:DUF6088 family protein [Nocardia puris]MBF6215809.1 hypothetical protein [Nocardia puris]
MTVALGAAGKALQAAPVGSFVHTKDLPGSPAAAASAVKRARQRGELVRIRKGLYFKGVKTRYGMTRPPAEAIAAEVLGRTGVGPTGFSAARAFGLTTQVPAKPAMAVTGRSVPTGLPVRVNTRSNLARTSLRPLEIAALELLRGDWEITVDDGWPALVSAVGQAMGSGKLRWNKLVAAAEREHSSALRETMARLRDDLRASGIIT